MFEYWGLAFLIPRVTAGYSVLYSSVLDISKFKLHHALSPPSPLGLTLWALIYCKSLFWVRVMYDNKFKRKGNKI